MFLKHCPVCNAGHGANKHTRRLGRPHLRRLEGPGREGVELCPVGPTPPSQRQLSTDRSPGTGDPDTLLFNKLAVGFGSRPVPKTRNRLPTSPGGGGSLGPKWLNMDLGQIFSIILTFDLFIVNFVF